MARRRAPAKKGLSALDLPAELEGGAAPCYLLLGPEAFLRNGALQVFREALIGDNPGPSYQVFDGRKAELAPILDELRTFPFLGTTHRLVVVTDAGLTGGFVQKYGEQLAAYLAADPSSSSTLVVVADKLDKRLKSSKALLGAAKTVDCDPPGDEAGQLRFIRQRAKVHGCEFARRADFALLERLGGQDVSLSALDAEVQKLSGAAQGGTITAEDVAALASSGSSEQAFGLIDCIGRGDVNGALTTLQRILRDGLITAGGSRTTDVNGIAMILLPTLRWDLSRLLRARALLEKGASNREITKQARVFRGQDAFMARVRRADAAELRRRHAIVRQADVDLRSSADAEGTITRVVAALALAERRRRSA